MEALAAIGLASNVIGFVELGFKLVDMAKDIHKSSVGSTEEDASYLRMVTALKASVGKLSAPKDESSSEQEVAIYSTASECADIARQLCRLLEKTRVTGRASWVEVAKATFQSLKKKKEKEDLINRLDHALNGLNAQLHLLTSMQRTQLQSIDAKLQENFTKASHNTAVITELLKILEKHRQSLCVVRQHQILESLRFDLMNAREEGIVDAHEATYEWILKPEDCDEPEELERFLATFPQLQASRQFQAWLQKSGGIFFIMGKPGAGKSVLMEMLSRNEDFHRLLARASDGPQLIVDKFFFWNAGGENQKSFGCLEWKETEQFSGQSWTAHHDSKTINNAFEQLLCSESLYRNEKLVFLIDGLDELEVDHRYMVQRIRSWSTTGGDNLKICVASREWNVFSSGFSDCESFKLQTLTHKDMVRTARDTLAGSDDFKRLDVPDRKLESFAERLAEKAEGVFLWTSLVLRLIEDGLSDGDEFRHLQSKLDVLPRDMKNLFEHMLTSISPENQGYALKMLHFVSGSTAAGRPPLLLRMLFLDHLYDSPQGSDPIHLLASEFRGLSRPEAEGYLQNKLSMLSKRIIGRSKCLLEIRPIVNYPGLLHKGIPSEHTPFYDKTVHFAHRKVKEYVESERAMSLLKKFTDGAQWQAEIRRTLIANVQFLIESEQTFFDWPHGDDLEMRFQRPWADHFATRDFGARFTGEVASVIGLSDQETAGSTPTCVLEFLHDILAWVERESKYGQNLEVPCRTGLFDPSCGSLHDVHERNAWEPGFSALRCGRACHSNHVSLFHLCGFLAIPEFLETLLTNTGLRRKGIPDPAGLVRAIVFPPQGSTVTRERSIRRANIFNMVIDFGLRLDQIPYDCWCEGGGHIQLGYRWTVWQVLIFKRLLGQGRHILPEDWSPIVERLLIMGIDTQFFLAVHHELAKEHLSELEKAPYPYDDGERQYVLAELWTRPVDKVSEACFGQPIDEGPDHGPMAVFLLATDSKLAMAAKEKGGVLPPLDLFEFMGVCPEASHIKRLSAPRIPRLVGWKYSPPESFIMYKDDAGDSISNHLNIAAYKYGATTDVSWRFEKSPKSAS
ncbi:hypothetical protein PG991_013327 [Apiospora marii]|uniref:NACHT domain-containing protein n=1 Tax=Apiospora marii TaxID=335849 RepID=A0ABR1R5N9_9PEZI